MERAVEELWIIRSRTDVQGRNFRRIVGQGDLPRGLGSETGGRNWFAGNSGGCWEAGVAAAARRRSIEDERESTEGCFGWMDREEDIIRDYGECQRSLWSGDGRKRAREACTYCAEMSKLKDPPCVVIKSQGASFFHEP